MGQKIHPNGFRLVTTQEHLSIWYAFKVNYSRLILEDLFIRTKVNHSLKEFLSLSRIKIKRCTKKVFINIYTLIPREKEMVKILAQYLKEYDLNTINKVGFMPTNLKDKVKHFTNLFLVKKIQEIIFILKNNKELSYYIYLHFIRSPFHDAILIAKFVANQLEKRITFRRAILGTIQKVQKNRIKGIKIQIAGRLNGADIARTEWKKSGQIPLHTLDTFIDYSQHSAQTIYGTIGIKIWLCNIK